MPSHLGRFVNAVGTCTLTVVLSVALGACAEELPPTQDAVPPAAPAEESPDPYVDGIPTAPLFLLGAAPDQAGSVSQQGRGEVDVTVSTHDGGAVRVSTGPQGGPAVRFPRYTEGPVYPRAVAIARSGIEGDPLSPGTTDFRYGARFRLDGRSFGRAEDNGNNVVQRGLASDPVMYKLEVDFNLRPACTVKGSLGALTVISPKTIAPGVWHEVVCERVGSRVSIRHTELRKGTRRSAMNTERGLIGSLTVEDGTIPISVGGKVAHNGRVIVSATDQFNGSIAAAFIDFD